MAHLNSSAKRPEVIKLLQEPVDENTIAHGGHCPWTLFFEGYLETCHIKFWEEMISARFFKTLLAGSRMSKKRLAQIKSATAAWVSRPGFKDMDDGACLYMVNFLYFNDPHFLHHASFTF